jgi:hypothetical protein
MMIAMSRPRLMQALAFVALILLVVFNVIPWYAWLAWIPIVAVQVVWEGRHDAAR